MNGVENYWSINPQSVGDAVSKLAAYTQYLQQNPVKAGPADEAERDGLPIRVTNGVAIVPIMGPMIRRASALASYFGICGTDNIRIAIQTALADEDISSILLCVDSPGGSVSGLDQLGDVIHGADKPIIAQVEGMCASAAYYVASQADQILVGRGDLVGSIGTRIMLYDWSKAFEESGIKAIPIDTGEFKSAGAMGTEITDEQQADFQRIVDFYFDDFVSAVSRGRSLSESAVREVGDGRMFTPAEASAAGLIDGISTLTETLNELRASARTGRSTETARARMRI